MHYLHFIFAFGGIIQESSTYHYTLAAYHFSTEIKYMDTEAENYLALGDRRSCDFIGGQFRE